uniref:Uncharacterized mitochondrial protein AtMg00810-like n=1 Tax=Tanacetum cinerariifolium TaxID=118510 RepID=A0A6L2LYL7_TANCI|nr:uncharacterized mitochondrial protein AtMg00810-like [Tanacetum cinerariifolium]
MLNNSQGKKQEVEDHLRNVKFSKNKTSVTACNDSLNAKTSNVNFFFVTCGKCVLNEKHDMCVLKSHNDVNSRTKMPMVVPISTKERKRIINQFVAKPLRRTVASESTNQKPRQTTRMLYEHVSKACSWWYPKFTPPGYKWKPKSQIGNVNPNLIEIILFIFDSGCSKHMTGNIKLLTNFVEKFLGTVKFRNDQFAPILGYGDLVQGAVIIKRVYYVERLNHNLFSVDQFCDADLEVAFRKSTCYIRDSKGNDLLTGSSGIDHLCSSCELGKAKRKSFQTKTTPSSKRRLQLLHMDLCGPMRVESINGNKYVVVIVDDYSRYTWTHFLRSKDETPKVLIDFLRLVQSGLYTQVRIVRTDKGTEFLNKTLHAYFVAEGINHQTSVARTPEQNGVVKRQNRTLVEAARTMLSTAKVPMFFWVEAIATSCFTQNHSLLRDMLKKGVDFEESFAPVARLEAVRLFIAYAHGMTSCDSIGTPMATKHLDADLSGTPVDQMKYQSMVGALMYLTASRHDIVHATCYCARYQAKPTEKHLTSVKRIFRYLKDTINMGLLYPKDTGFELTSFSYSDHAGCLDSRKSTSSGIQFLGGDKLVSWSSKKQDCTSMSLAKVEYVFLSACCTQVLWMRTQLTDYGFHFDKIPMYCDSKAAISISCNPV